MKTTILISIFLSNYAMAGTFLQKGMYVETDLTIGFGKSRIIAMNEAEKAIPEFYDIDLENNSPAVQCTGLNVWNEKNECGSEMVRYVLPLRKNGS